MKEPERHLSVHEDHRVFRADLLSPIILLSDLEFIFSKKAIWDGEAWRISFKKIGPQDRQPWGVKLWTNDKKQLIRFQLPQKLSEILGNEFVMRAIEAIGRGEVSIGKRRVYMNLKALVTEKQVLQLMGSPKEIEEGPTNKIMFYEFGQLNNPFSVSIKITDSVNSVVMETNGYGIEVMVKKLEDLNEPRE
jgi:hypothetical protein